MTVDTCDRGSARTILIADDEQPIRFLLKRCFQSAGFGVLEAECGLRALELIEQDDIGVVDVLVTDIEMPNIDGITLAERCKRRFPDLRVVVMSGVSQRAIPAVGTTVDAVLQPRWSPQNRP